MKNSNIELPPVNLKFAGLVKGELVTLTPDRDDKDYARVYEIMERNGSRLSVKVVSEIAINPEKYSQAHNSEASLMGETFSNIDESYFQPYL